MGGGMGGTDDRPITYADLDRWSRDTERRLGEIAREMRTFNESLGKSDRHQATLAERVENHGKHLMQIQEKLDNAGIDGTRRLDSGSVTLPMLASIGAGVITLASAAGGFVAWLFETFKSGK